MKGNPIYDVVSLMLSQMLQLFSEHFSLNSVRSVRAVGIK